MSFVGGVFSLRGGRARRRRHLVRLVALRGPALPLDAPVGRGRLPARRDHRDADHDGRHAQGLLGPEGPPRGHGREPRRGVARVPELPALLRPDLPRAPGQGARGPLREGVQRLDVRRVVRRHRRPPDPAADRAALGREPRGRRGAAQRGARRPRRSASARSRRSSASRRCTTTTATGTRSSGRARRPDTVVSMHIGSTSKMPSTSADAPAAVGSTLTYMNAAMSITDYLMSGIVRALPEARSRVLRGPDRLDPVRARAGRQGVGGQPRLGRRRRQGAEAAVGVLLRARLRLLLRRPARPEVAESVGVDNITFETDYPHSDSTWPHTEKVAQRHHGGPHDEEILKLVPRQRDPHAPPRLRAVDSTRPSERREPTRSATADGSRGGAAEATRQRSARAHIARNASSR